MQKIKLLSLTILISMLILTACNIGTNEQADEKNESGATEIKKDPVSSLSNTTLDQKNEVNNEHINVPALVKNEYMKRYPESKSQHIICETENGNYEANWGGQDGEVNSVIYTPSGIFVEIINAIPLSQLPQSANNYINLLYKSAHFCDIGKVLDAQGKTSYEVEINGKDVNFDANGNFVKLE